MNLFGAVTEPRLETEYKAKNASYLPAGGGIGQTMQRCTPRMAPVHPVSTLA